MARKRRTSIIEDLIRLVVILFLVGSSSFFAFWNNLTDQERTLFLVALVVLLVSGAGLIITWVRYRNHQRELAWKRSMASWDQSQREDLVVHNHSARYLTPGHLEKFATQLFKQMGYRVNHTGQTGDHGVDVRLVNPKGEVEVVQCKQWNKPVGEKEVRDLLGTMAHEKAIRGFLFAPGGFSSAARSWAKGKRIVLADEKEIGRLVESAYGGKN